MKNVMDFSIGSLCLVGLIGFGLMFGMGSDYFGGFITHVCE